MPRRQNHVASAAPVLDAGSPDAFSAPSTVDSDATEDAGGVPFGQDLKADMLNALAKLDFQGNSGKFAGSQVFAEAPNPWLYIEGLGMIGLPFSERDANNIVTSFNQAPPTFSSRANNTWRIDSHAVSIRNPEWNRYLNSVILKFITAELGVAEAPTAPRLELEQVSICEIGSSFVSEHGTGVAKPNGTYATVLVSLPSTYTGGAISVSQGGQSKVLDVSSMPLLPGVSFWFTELQHTAQPVRSGYLLALVYHLVHTSAVVPTPSPPVINNALDHVRGILCRWQQGLYTEEWGGKTNVVVSLLQNQSGLISWRQGLKGLQDSDARILGNLRSVAEDLGYHLGIGTLECKAECFPDNGYDDEYDDDGYNSNCSSLMDVDECSMSITAVVDLNGTSFPGISNGRLAINEDNLLQGNFYLGAKPDYRQRRSNDYYGDESVVSIFTRDVFVIFHKQYARQLMLKSGGFSYAISELKKVVPSLVTPEDRSLANVALSKLGNIQHLSQLLDIALTWEDLTFWKNVCKKAKSPSAIQENELLAALKTFGFDAISPFIEGRIDATHDLSRKIGFIDTVSVHLGAASSRPNWQSEHHLKALSSAQSLQEGDIPQVMSMITQYGIAKVMDCLLPSIQRHDYYQGYYPVMTRKLYEGSMSCTDDAEAWQSYANIFLEITTKRWVKSGWGRNGRLDEALKLIDLCLSLGQVPACRPVLSVIVPGKQTYGIWDDYQRLALWIPQLSDILSRFDLCITSPPFDDLARHIAGSYSRDIVGVPKPKGFRAQTTIQIAKVGCGCQYCEALDTFLTSSQEKMDLRVPSASYHHLDEPLRRASPVIGNILISHIEGSFRIANLSKPSYVLATCRDANRVADTKDFFESLGGVDVISQLMGDRFVDVRRTLDERKPFEWPEDYLTQTWVPTAPEVQVSAISKTETPKLRKIQQSSAKSGPSKKKQKRV